MDAVVVTPLALIAAGIESIVAVVRCDVCRQNDTPNVRRTTLAPPRRTAPGAKIGVRPNGRTPIFRLPPTSRVKAQPREFAPRELPSRPS